MSVAKLNVVMPSLIVLLVAKLIQNASHVVTEILPHASKFIHISKLSGLDSGDFLFPKSKISNKI